MRHVASSTFTTGISSDVKSWIDILRYDALALFKRRLLHFLQEIAPRYFSTRFIRVFVESVPWLVEKLAIKVLPCVICFVGGVSKDR